MNDVSLLSDESQETIVNQDPLLSMQLQQEIEVTQEEIKIIQQCVIEKDVIDKINQQCDIQLILMNLQIDEKSRSNLHISLQNYTQLMISTQDMIQLFRTDELCIQQALQLCKVLQVGFLQIEQTIYIFNYMDDPLQFQVIMQRYAILNQHRVVAESFNDVNLIMMNLMINFLIKEIFSPLNIVCNKLQENQDKQDQIKLMRQMKILTSKLNSLIEMYPFALVTQKDDLFSLDQEHQDWQILNAKVTFKTLGTLEELKQSYDQVLVGILAANAMIQKSAECKNQAVKGIVQSFGAIYYMFAAQKGKDRAKSFMADPSQELAFKVWNLGESGMVKQMMTLMFPSIKYNKKIYIDRRFIEISSDFLKSQYIDNFINKLSPIDIKVDGCNLPTSQELYTKNPNKVCVRVLCHKELKCFEGSLSYTLQNQHSVNTNMFKKPSKVYDKIIIHIHGGGFVSQSSRSHQTYTRTWANSLQAPIFSIDYRKAPEDPYPAGLDDCWQAYLWIINYSQHYFNVNPQQVVLVGDSAGGNLVAALTILCIKSGMRVPDGILLAYPALNLNQQFFTPSLLISMDDGLLPHTILRLCLQSYVNNADFDADRDPLLSPSKASDEILKLFPRTRIIAGTNDPLHDESWRLAQRLVKLQKDFSMIIYPGMPHGFLSFDAPSGMKECRITVEDATILLNSLLTQSHYKKQMEEYLSSELNQSHNENQQIKQQQQ